MTSPRKPGFVLPVTVTVAVLLGLYVGAYYWSVVVDMEALAGRQPMFSWRLPIFAPIHWLDRRIRPHVWEPSQ